MTKEFSRLLTNELPNLVDYNFDLKTYLLNECDRLMTIFKPITISYIHIHKSKRVLISTKKTITGSLTIHRVKLKHTKKGLKQ